MYICGLEHIYTSFFVNQQILTFISSERAITVIMRTYKCVGRRDGWKGCVKGICLIFITYLMSNPFLYK